MIFLTDLVVLVWIIFFYHQGWKNGLLPTIRGPLSFILSAILGWLYFQKTHYIIGSLLITTLGPFFLFVILCGILSSPRQGNGRIAIPSLPSRVSGAVIGFIWGLCTMLPFLIILASIPNNLSPFMQLKQNVVHSYMYRFIDEFIQKDAPFVATTQAFIKATQDPIKVRKIQTTPEVSALLSDKAVQDILSDKEIAEHIKNKEIFQLLEHPKIQALWQNEDLKKKLTSLKERILEIESNPEYTQLEKQ